MHSKSTYHNSVCVCVYVAIVNWKPSVLYITFMMISCQLRHDYLSNYVIFMADHRPTCCTYICITDLLTL